MIALFSKYHFIPSSNFTPYSGAPYPLAPNESVCTRPIHKSGLTVMIDPSVPTIKYPTCPGIVSKPD